MYVVDRCSNQGTPEECKQIPDTFTAKTKAMVVAGLEIIGLQMSLKRRGYKSEVNITHKVQDEKGPNGEVFQIDLNFLSPHLRDIDARVVVREV